MKNIRRLIKLIAFASACLFFFGMSLNLAVSLPDEKTIVNTIFTEAKNTEDKINKKKYTAIAEFLYQKLKDFAAHNEDFSESEIVDLDDPFYSQGTSSDYLPRLFILDADNDLVVLPTSLGAYQGGGFLFIINRHKNQWAPVQLDQFVDKKIEKTYSVVIDNAYYDAPILSIVSRLAGYFGGFRVVEEYLFKDGTFKLIRSDKISLDEEKLEEQEAKGIDRNDPNFSYEDFMKQEIRYIDPKGKWHVDERKL